MVLECGSKENEISVIFPDIKGSYNVSGNITLRDNQPNALQIAFKDLQTQEKNQMPSVLRDLQIQAASLQSLRYCKSKSEMFEGVRSLLQNEVDVIHNWALLNETINVSYSNKVDEKLVEYIDTSVVKYNSSTLFDRMHDNFKNINKNNIQSKMMDVLKVAAKRLTKQYL